MIDDVRWLTPRMLEAFHLEAIHRFGGEPGLRDRALLESALARPLDRHAYDEDAGIFDLAAEYCAGIVGNYPFVDGNKRAGLLAAAVFLSMNGYDLSPDEALTVTMIEGLAAGSVDIAAISGWLSESARRKG